MAAIAMTDPADLIQHIAVAAGAGNGHNFNPGLYS